MIVLEPHPAPKKNWNDLSVLSTLSIRPSNSHGKSLKPQSLFSISTFLSKTTNWQPVSTTNPQIRTVTYCTRLPIHLTSKTQFRTPNFSDSVGLCSEDSDFNSKCDEMSNFFSERGYPDSILSKALNRVQNVNRESALEPSASDNEERIPFTLTFHPKNLAARNVVLRNFKILQSDPETAPIFPNPPLVSFKRDRNLRNSLVRSSLPSNLEPGTFNCSRKVCNTCPFINSKTHIRGTQRIVPSQWPFRLHNLQYHLLYHLYSLQQTLHWRVRP